MTDFSGDPAADIEAECFRRFQQAQRAVEDEYAHICEVEHELLMGDYPCIYKTLTGDDRYPVLCRLDDKYAKAEDCKDCKHRDEGVA